MEQPYNAESDAANFIGYRGWIRVDTKCASNDPTLTFKKPHFYIYCAPYTDRYEAKLLEEYYFANFGCTYIITARTRLDLSEAAKAINATNINNVKRARDRDTGIVFYGPTEWSGNTTTLARARGYNIKLSLLERNLSPRNQFTRSRRKI